MSQRDGSILQKNQTTAGSTSEGLVELIDLYPTLAELCDISAPDELQGRSLVSMIRNPKAAGKEMAYTVVARGPKLGKAIRTDRWHYTLWPDGNVELYNLKTDPTEEQNLAAVEKHKDSIKLMRAKLAQAESNANSARREADGESNSDN